MFDCFLACVLFFGTDAFLEFTTDTYRTFAVGVGKKAKDMLVRNGRPVIALYYKCFGMTGLPQEKFYYISFWTGLVLAAASLYVLSRLLEGIFQSRRKALLASLLVVINLFVIEEVHGAFRIFPFIDDPRIHQVEEIHGSLYFLDGLVLALAVGAALRTGKILKAGAGNEQQPRFGFGGFK